MTEKQHGGASEAGLRPGFAILAALAFSEASDARPATLPLPHACKRLREPENASKRRETRQAMSEDTPTYHLPGQIRITIPGQPVAKGRPRLARSGHAWTPEKTAKWETLAQWEARAQYDGSPLEGPLEVELWAYFAVPRSWPAWKRTLAEGERTLHTVKPDLDNIVKCLDAFNGLLFPDDSAICSIRCAKMYSANPRLEILIDHIQTTHTHSKRNDYRTTQSAERGTSGPARTAQHRAGAA